MIKRITNLILVILTVLVYGQTETSNLDSTTITASQDSSIIEFPEIKTIRYEITKHSLVSIIIPTRNLGQMLNECLTSIFELTTYDNYEVIVIDNGTDEPETLSIIEQWQNKEPKRFKSLQLDIPFNYSLF